MSTTPRKDRLTLDDMAADLRGPIKKMPSTPSNMFGIRVMRGLLRLMKSTDLEGVVVADHEVDGNRVRVYTPIGHRTSGALLWIHGGGMVLGDLVQDDSRCAEWAVAHDIVVVSTNYRLAPEHPYPAPLDDCHATWEWVLKNAPALGIDSDQIVIGGQSAGGGLAAALVLRIHDAGGTQPAGQWLFCPMLDDRTAADRTLDPLKHFVWNNRANLNGWRAYLGKRFRSGEVPGYAAPARRSDFAGLPPAWVGVGEIDLFHDETVRYAQHLKMAGVAVELDVVAGAPHAFESIARDSDTARSYLQRANKWLSVLLGTGADVEHP